MTYFGPEFTRSRRSNRSVVLWFSVLHNVDSSSGHPQLTEVSPGGNITAMSRLALLLSLSLTSLLNITAASSLNISSILNSFQVGYDRRVRPNYGGVPVTVGVTLYILSVGDLSEKFMDFTFDMYFRQFWTDPRYYDA